MSVNNPYLMYPLQKSPTHSPPPGAAMENPQLQRSRLDDIQMDRAPRAHPQFRNFHHVASPTRHSSTPPINVPPPNPGWSDPHPYHGGSGNALEEAGFLIAEEPSPIRRAARARKSSISFDPKVKTDAGRQLQLQDAPPPSAQVGDYFQKLSTSVPAEEATKPSSMGGLGAAFHRSHSSSQLVSQMVSRYDRPRRRTASAATRFLQKAPPVETIDGVASLTSDSTLSPGSDFHTPPENAINADSYFPPDISRSPLQDPRVLQGLSPWRKPNDSSGIGRNKSFNFERRERSRSRSTVGRRTMSERSLNTCSGGISPASLFLNSFNSNSSHAQSQSADPDEEGQEVGPYVLGKQIGFGGFSIVREAYTMEDTAESRCAVKIVRKRVHDAEMENDKIQAEFEHEIALWRIVNHKNILPLIAVYDTPFATFAFMKLNTGGSLFDLVKKNRKGIAVRHVRRYGSQLASALRYLHEDLRIVHGDVKLENCLLNISEDAEEGGNVMLCDFGLSKYIRGGNDSDSDDEMSDGLHLHGSDSHSTLTGSLQYASPELFKSAGTVTPASDVWAYGATIYALHTGTLPFSHTFAPKLQWLIMNGDWDVDRLRQCWGLVEAKGKEASKVVEVVKGCLCRNTHRRWTIRDVLKSPWLEDCS